jgi:hypothetical protein
LAVITVAIIAGLVLLPGSGCVGMGAITTGVCSHDVRNGGTHT